MSLSTNLSDLTTRIATEVKSLRVLINNNVADLTALTTTAKTNLVAAVNEVNANKQPLDSDLTTIAAANNGTILANTTASFLTAQSTKLGHISVTQAVNLDQMESDIAGLANGMVYKGDWSAAGGTFPAGANIGDFYYVSVGGTVDAVVFDVGDNIVATVNGASTTVYAGNWSKHDQTDAVQSVVGQVGSVTATQIRDALLAVDGAGSGLDADLLDGLSSAAFQLADAELSAIAGLTSAADRLPYFTGSGTASLATFTAAGRALVDDASATAQRTTLGLGTAATTASTDYATAAQGTLAGTALQPAAIGVSIQAYDADLQAIAGLAGQTSYGRNFLTLADQAALVALLPSGSDGYKFVQEAQPTATAVGQMWYNTGNGESYVWYDSYWVQTSLQSPPSDGNKQDVSDELTAIAGLTSAADQLPYFTGLGTASLATLTAAGRALIDDVDAAAQRTTLGLGTAATQASTAFQASDAELTAIAGLTSVADRLPYFTGSGTAALATFTAAGRALVDDVDAAAQRTTLGLGTAATQASTAFQASDTELTAIAGLVSAADRLPYFTGSGTASLATFTAAGRALVDDANVAAQRTTLDVYSTTEIGSVTTDFVATFNAGLV